MPTARAGWTTDALTDLADGPAALAELANQVDLSIGAVSCTSGARPSTGLYEGFLAYETDTDQLIRRTSGAWVVVAGAAWVAFTASFTNCPGTTTARYKKVGRTVDYRIEHVMSGAPTGGVGFSLPVAPLTPPAGTAPSYGIIHGKDVSAGQYVTGQAIHNSGSTIRVMLAATSTSPNLADMTATVPLTWASGDFLSIWGTYEAAS
jgi:hypothetical protein